MAGQARPNLFAPFMLTLLKEEDDDDDENIMKHLC